MCLIVLISSYTLVLPNGCFRNVAQNMYGSFVYRSDLKYINNEMFIIAFYFIKPLIFIIQAT